ncbi:GNAT family N-acetyltransferase [Aestuariirhabdus sp. LZHN29]|uniref:GNAT family N-acetyltransferase n=1 Tax=Aestuariirhabdus sp. LZHN29 TaxID=3417462 RepID=UPI003CF12775
MNPNTNFHILQKAWADAEAEIMALRSAVFHQEQGIELTLMGDAQDVSARHFLLYLESNNIPIGTARMLSNGRIGRVAIYQRHRGQGLGLALMNYLHDIAIQQGLSETTLHAQSDSIGFYQRLGYLNEGEPFEEAGIPHQAMKRTVPSLDTPIDFTPDPGSPHTIIKAPSAEDYTPRGVRPAGEPIETDATLGETGALPHLTDLSQIVDHIAALIKQADEKVFIYAPTLVPTLFGHPKVLAAISASARRNPLSKVQILVSETASLVKQHHPLLHLQQRINSLISLRCTIPAYRLDSLTLVLADATGWLEIIDDKPLTLSGNFNDAGRVKQWYERIEHPWNHSVVPKDIRQMSL